MPTVRMKICTCCGKRKKIEDFSKRTDRRCGYKSHCKECVVNNTKEYKKRYRPAPLKKRKLDDRFLGY